MATKTFWQRKNCGLSIAHGDSALDIRVLGLHKYCAWYGMVELEVISSDGRAVHTLERFDQNYVRTLPRAEKRDVDLGRGIKVKLVSFSKRHHGVAYLRYTMPSGAFVCHIRYRPDGPVYYRYPGVYNGRTSTCRGLPMFD